MILGFWENVKYARLKRTGQYLDAWDMEIKKHGYPEIIDKRSEMKRK